MSFIPRDYQCWADQALWDFVHTKPGKNPLIVLPTGTGKSLCIGMFMWRMLASYPHLRMMMLTHVKELIEGNYNTLRRLWPAAPAGVFSAGLGQKDAFAQLTFGGIQSVAKAPGRFGKIDFILIDEAHLLSDKENSGYVKFIQKLKEKNPNLIVIGFTATPFRMGMGMLTDGTLFDEVAFDGSDGEAFIWFLENGYLIRPVPKDPGFQLDESSIGIQAGDFNNKEASAALAEQDILERAVDMMIALGEEQNRQSWLSFCQSIEDAELVADMFRYKGYPVEAVHSKRSDRDEVLKEFKAGGLRGVTNKDILTTGFDHPPIDMIGMLRLTRSPGLWVQMIGRGTRPVYAPGFDLLTKEGRLASIAASQKQNTLVLDFVGNTERLGTINYPNLPKRRGAKDGGPPVRICPQCDTYLHISVKVCTECGYEFPQEVKVRKDASSSQLVESKVLDLINPPETPKIEDKVYGVNRMIAAHNEGRRGKKDTMRVDYFCGFNRFSTWVCFEHDEGSFPRTQAERWWKAHGGQGVAPVDVGEALEQVSQLNKPKFIKVRMGGKYPEIREYDFRGTRFELPPELGGPPLAEPDPDPLEANNKRLEEEKARIAKIMEDHDDIPF